MNTDTSIPFRGFDERDEVRIYDNDTLPHWRQTGCAYFVTFRQADSLPEPVQREMEYERKLWLTNHGIAPEARKWKDAFAKLPQKTRREYERRVGTTLDKHLDAGHGGSVLGHKAIGKIVADALLHFHGTRVLNGDLVVMPNPIHALMTPLPGFELEDILHSIKSYSANRINEVLGQSGTFWQRESYDHIVRDYEQLEAFQQYIAANPGQAHLDSEHFINLPARYRPDE